MNTPPIAVSDSLRLQLAQKPLCERDIEIAAAFATGAMRTAPASVSRSMHRHARRLADQFARKWQRSPDRAASVRRRRQLGGSSSMPDTIRHPYTEGQRAALAIVSGEVKHHGVCDLALDR